ncbi:MAG: GntR family transcriptional regulator [Chloroflexota bacterium]|nr:GntR family transcriptional regulator [Chloroflexota bacterium]
MSEEMSNNVRRRSAPLVPFPATPHRTYKTIVVDKLRDLIQELALPPGERLVEADLAARFAVSQTPIREALQLLERDGLVTLVPHTGATVTWLSLAQYEQELFIVDALELPALRLIVERITPSELRTYRQTVEAMQRAQLRHDRRAYRQLALRMHRELFAAARYPRLDDLIRDVNQRHRRYAEVFIYQFEENWQRDVAVSVDRMELLLRNDAEGAAEAVRRGHAALLEFATRQVVAQVPSVMRYVLPLAAATPPTRPRRLRQVRPRAESPGGSVPAFPS